MTDEIKQLQVELRLEGKKIMDCSDLQEAFGTKNHRCLPPVKCYHDRRDNIFYFLCETHKGFKRMEFRIIENFGDVIR